MELTGIANITALVTGASGGIGRGIVRALSAAGAKVAATDITVGTQQDTGGAPGLVRTWRMDVTDPAEVENTVTEVEDILGPIHLLVNAAGVLGRLAPLVDQEPHDFERLFAVNVRGTFLCCRSVARRMAPRGRGCIITVASSSTAILRTDQTLYAGSKAAAGYLTTCLGLELAPRGIRCLVVNPGTTDTSMARARATPDRTRDLLEGNLGEYRPGIPLGRLATPSDIADAVLFLASDQARHITCTDLRVDGGAVLRPW
uniref:Putative 2,3-dihydro-2,3-dihydroxy benzoate dehydrogenase n=1 Tax=Streptomyces argenteolus TaxID=67274 RepID=A9ZNU8_9ACTN|nr:putative 2,3-dihydro-2,3-dihydroxy benzoate dehydrogenase [Streptomyces argenteolus]